MKAGNQLTLVCKVLLFTLLILPFTANAQERTMTVHGTVLDGETRKPLVFASVSLSDVGISIVTNGEGYFALKFPERFKDHNILISYLGYQTVSMPLNLFQNDSKNGTVVLMPIALPLPMTTIRPNDPLAIVESAFARIHDNYPQEPMQMTGFYREMIKKGNTYVTLSEAVVDVFNASYGLSFAVPQVGIYKGRGSIDHSRIDTIFVKFQGGIRSSMEMDVMQSPFLGVNYTEIGQYYDFTMESPVQMNDRLNYVISFNQKPTLNEMLFRGKLYIEVESLAVTRIEFNMNVEGFPNNSLPFIRRKPAGLRTEVEYAAYMVQYKPLENGRWTFDHARMDLKFEAKWDKKLFKNHYSISSEMAMTQYSNQAYKIPAENRVKTTDITLYKVADFEDPDFWEDYNVIEPEASIENVINRIIRQLRRRSE